jgi:hypothetical protein
MLSHPALLVAVHGQAALEALTLTLPVPPLEPKFRLVGLIEKVQPDCETVKVCPCKLIVPLRAGPMFALTEKVTVPLPVPLTAVIVIH